MQRTIEIADFELPRGPVAIGELLAMPRADWEHLRAEINRRRIEARDRPLAVCRLCQKAVYIKSVAGKDGHAPLFAHLGEGLSDCPWFTGNPLRPDDARAAQYQGHQESALHAWMCRTIAEVAGRDLRCTDIAIDTYRRLTIAGRGLWPDVFFEMAGIGQFALEIQLSKPFAPEVAMRHLRYERGDVSLIWIFRDIDANPPQGFRDVITMQRGNVFLFDEAALKASIAQSKLILTCLLESPTGYLKPRLVGLDELDLSAGRAVFLEDRRSAALAERCKAGRALWWKAFLKPPEGHDYTFEEAEFGRAWTSIRAFVPTLPSWKSEWWQAHRSNGERHFAQFAAILFSIVHSAVAGADTLHISAYRGQGALVAMLNSKLTSIFFKPYADLFDLFLSRTSLADLLSRDSLKKLLLHAKLETAQIGPEHPVWAGARRLFPEVLDPILRTELEDLDQLPDWAMPPTPLESLSRI